MDTASSTRSPLPFVSSRKEWDDKFDILVLLWRGMTYKELMKEMEENYGFRATIDQYKKKFGEWKRKGLLPARKPRKIALERTVEEEDMIDEGGCSLIPESTIDNIVQTTENSPMSAAKNTRGGCYYGSTPQIARYCSGDYHSQAARTKRQQQFTKLLTDLWDAYFDIGFRDDDEIRVCDAVRAMMKFIRGVAATDPDLSSVIDCSGDLKLLKKVNKLFYRKFPNQTQSLKQILPQCQAIPPPRPKEYLIFCCQCNGPYLSSLYSGCIMNECAYHEFCNLCGIETEEPDLFADLPMWAKLFPQLK